MRVPMMKNKKSKIVSVNKLNAVVCGIASVGNVFPSFDVELSSYEPDVLDLRIEAPSERNPIDDVRNCFQFAMEKCHG